MIRTINDKYYVFKSKIGSGSFSKVYKAIESETNETFAIKIINTSKLSPPLIKRLSNEIEILKSMNHPNIISLHNYSITDKHIYMVMEYCNDGTIRDKIGKLKSENDIKYYVKQIVDGMLYLETMNILHRDIKPENILISNNIVKIIDFGFSSDIKNDDMYSTICGTPMYMSPELLRCDKYDKKSDIWSLGVITYELFHHTNPFGKPKNMLELQNIIKKNNIIYKSTISKSLLHFISTILQEKMSLRPTLLDICNHEWFKDNVEVQHKKKKEREEIDDIFEMDEMDDMKLTSESKLQHTLEEVLINSNDYTTPTSVEQSCITSIKSDPIDISSKKQIGFNIIENFFETPDKTSFPKAQTVDQSLFNRNFSSPPVTRPSSLTKVLQMSGRFIKNIMDYTNTNYTNTY